MANILVTGGTGLIGRAISNLLIEEGYEITHLSRKCATSVYKTFKWDITNRYIDEEALNVDYIIHLTGAGIADKRWTKSRKKAIYESRINSTNLLLEKVKNLKINLKGFICASAIGFYGAAQICVSR